jgi:hypothetical protein
MVDVVMLGEHAPQAVLDDHRDLVAVGRVVGHAVGNGRSDQVAVTVLVLQTLAVERGAPGCAADEEAARPGVARGPCQVPDPLEPEHRVEDVERDHRLAVVGVGRGGGDPRGHRARLADARLEDLALPVLPVVHELLGVLGLVELAHLREDPELAEHPFHAERA